MRRPAVTTVFDEFLLLNSVILNYTARDHLPRKDERRDAEGRSAQHERDDDDVPCGAMIVEPWEVERMQAVIEPARDPAARAVRADQARGLRVDVVPRAIGAAKLGDHHRQRPRAAAIEIVRVVS